MRLLAGLSVLLLALACSAAGPKAKAKRTANSGGGGGGGGGDSSASVGDGSKSDSYYYARALSPSTAADDALLVSTLEGTLLALDAANGDVLWALDDEPVVKSPYDAAKPTLPAFLPDPKDGSIYMIGAGPKEPLKRLPFTIPQLVAASPCKSSDGVLYTGKKVDKWFAVDKRTGDRQGTVSFDGCPEQGAEEETERNEQQMCPSLKPGNFLIGRTEYNIMMLDSRASPAGRKWNITFYDYSANAGSGDVGEDYGTLKHALYLPHLRF